MRLLDTSAVLAHFFQEPGGDIVDSLLREGNVWLATPTLLELRVKLMNRTNPDEIVEEYRQLSAGIVDVTVEVVRAAFSLRAATHGRLPLVDSMIAGAAKVRGFQLVHRDAHMARIPQDLLAHTILPAKA